MQMNVQYSLIQEFMFYEFKLGHSTVAATQNICCTKSEDAVIHSKVTKC